MQEVAESLLPAYASPAGEGSFLDFHEEWPFVKLLMVLDPGPRVQRYFGVISLYEAKSLFLPPTLMALPLLRAASFPVSSLPLSFLCTPLACLLGQHFSK